MIEMQLCLMVNGICSELTWVLNKHLLCKTENLKNFFNLICSYFIDKIDVFQSIYHPCG